MCRQDFVQDSRQRLVLDIDGYMDINIDCFFR